MFSFQEYLTEIFDSFFPYKKTTNEEDKIIYKFTTRDGKKGDVFFQMFQDIPNSNEWVVDFSINRRFIKTGTGEAPQIFATVIKIIAEFLKEIKPKKLEFEAAKEEDSDSRASLYSKMIKKMAGSTGYNFKEQDYSDKKEFILTRI